MITTINIPKAAPAPCESNFSWTPSGEETYKFSKAPELKEITANEINGELKANTYYYYVAPLINGIEGSLSNQQGYDASATNKWELKLEWTEIPAATGYRIYRGTSSGKENVYIEVGKVTKYADKGPGFKHTTLPSNEYKFKTTPVGKLITFESISKTPIGVTISEYYWKFSDGYTYKGNKVLHTFEVENPNTSVSLVILDSRGLEWSCLKYINPKYEEHMSIGRPIVMH